MAKEDEVTEGAETSGNEALEALTEQVKEMAKDLKKAQAEAKKAAKAAEEAKAELDEAKLNMGGNNLKKMSAWRMPPTAGHVQAGTTQKMPSGNSIVNA